MVPTPFPDFSSPLAAHPLAPLFDACGPLHFADEPLYTPLCRLIARSGTLLGWLDAAPAGQRRPNLVLAALHEAVLAEAEAQPGEPPQGLAAWYASVGGRHSAHDAALPAALGAFVAQHGERLRRHLAERATQTNEVGRCAVLRPALDHIARQHGPRLALFDFGCSAGLNLTVDRQSLHVTAWPPAPDPRVAPGVGPAPDDGPADRLHCHWQWVDADGTPVAPPQAAAWPWPEGPLPPPAWQLLARTGCDPAPANLADADALRWLRACLWPSDTRRRRRLDRAVTLARELAPPIHQAVDGLAVLQDWLAHLPPATTPVLFNSWVLAYLSPAELAWHRARVLALVQQHGLLWLSAEDRRITRQLTGLCWPDDLAPPLPGAAGPADSHTLWTLTEPGPQAPVHRLLANSHPHGTWVQWRVDQPPAAAQ